MTHLDEGTIHAWLDGAVDATQLREIEAHVAQCSTCAAAVAEARGLIAGSSRILNALDDVPAGVIPPSPVVAPASARRPPVRKRQWRAAPWVTSIAAALMLAIGVTTWNRNVVEGEMAKLDLIAASQPQAAAPAEFAGQTTTSATPANTAPKAAVTDTVRRRASAPATTPRKALAREQRLGNVVAADVPATAPVAPSAAAPVAEITRETPAASKSAEARKRSLADTSIKLENVVVTGLSSRRDAQASDVEMAAGCYRIQGASGPRRLVPSVGAVAGAVAAAAGRGVAPTEARVPSRAAAEYVAPPVPALLRLDTLRRPLGYVVRSAASDSAMGWWTRLGADSVKVDMLAAGVFTFAAKDRVSCPER